MLELTISLTDEQVNNLSQDNKKMTPQVMLDVLTLVQNEVQKHTKPTPKHEYILERLQHYRAKRESLERRFDDDHVAVRDAREEENLAQIALSAFGHAN